MTNTATQTTSNGPHATPASESTNSFARPARGGVSFVHPLAGQTHRGEAKSVTRRDQPLQLFSLRRYNRIPTSLPIHPEEDTEVSRACDKVVQSFR